ncbi:hypothetical protein CANMA_004055, partial [Candida margitis]|uniref:uncharacterized protein n=1 Tax=Candida margitis TaxID=1775924 RepID=UPI002225CDC9
VSQSGTSLTTITTFPQPVQTEYTTTWTTTKSDGSIETDSGIVSQSGTSLTTITTFPQPVQTEYTTTWTTTKSDGSVETDSGIVSQSGGSLTTVSTYVPVLSPSSFTRWTNSSLATSCSSVSIGATGIIRTTSDISESLISSETLVPSGSSYPSYPGSEAHPIGVYSQSTHPIEELTGSESTGSELTSVTGVLTIETESSAPQVSVESSLVTTPLTTSNEIQSQGTEATPNADSSSNVFEVAESSAAVEPTNTQEVASSQPGLEQQSSSYTDSVTTLTNPTSGSVPSAAVINTYEGAGSRTKFTSSMGVFVAFVYFLF